MKFGHLIYCLFVGVLHFIYTICFPSILNGERFFSWNKGLLEPSYIHAFFLSRLKFGEFARRPVTTWLIQYVESIGITLDVAFVIVLYLGLLASMALLFKLALDLNQTVKTAKISVLLYAFSFWVIHSFFAEIYAYDEPWQYAFLFASLIFLHREKYLIFSVFALLALITRESTALLLPGIVLAFVIKHPLWTKQNLVNLVKVAWVVLAYGLFLYYFIDQMDLEEKSSSYMRDVRFNHLLYSFEKLDIGIDTLTSFVMSIILPVTLLISRYKTVGIKEERPWVLAFLLSFGINAFITFAFTMGRETRIFAQPAIFLLPFLGQYAIALPKQFEGAFRITNLDLSSIVKWIALISFSSSVIFGISLFAYELYWPTDTKFFTGFQHYVFIHLSISFLIFFTLILRAENTSEPSGKTRRLLIALLFIPVIIFFGNQQGYRGEGTFGSAVEDIEQISKATDRPQFVIVGTHLPNAAENYFSAKGFSNMAGDFNFQLPTKQFFYHHEDFQDHDIIYVEQHRPTHFPFRYILSLYGELEHRSFGAHEGFIVHTDRKPIMEANSYRSESDHSAFNLTDKRTAVGEQWVDGEYSLAFKKNLSELGIDSLTSFAAHAMFKADINSNAAIVVSIEAEGELLYWEHDFLNVYLIELDGWNTAYKARRFPAIYDSNAVISFYVWNPELEDVTVKDLEITLNSKLVY